MVVERRMQREAHAEQRAGATQNLPINLFKLDYYYYD
jgi:hypothetical protein